MPIHARKRRASLQVLIAEILALQAGFTAGLCYKFGTLKYLVKIRHIDVVQHVHLCPGTVADALEKTDSIKWLGLGASPAADHRRIGSGADHRNGLHLVIIERKQIAFIL